MDGYYTHKVEFLIKRDSDLYRQIERYAERHDMPVESVVDMITQVGSSLFMKENLAALEARDSEDAEE